MGKVIPFRRRNVQEHPLNHKFLIMVQDTLLNYCPVKILKAGVLRAFDTESEAVAYIKGQSQEIIAESLRRIGISPEEAITDIWIREVWTTSDIKGCRHANPNAFQRKSDLEHLEEERHSNPFDRHA
jgi:hypothetical protein